jgi:hypothetical protein
VRISVASARTLRRISRQYGSSTLRVLSWVFVVLNQNYSRVAAKTQVVTASSARIARSVNRIAAFAARHDRAHAQAYHRLRVDSFFQLRLRAQNMRRTGQSMLVVSLLSVGLVGMAVAFAKFASNGADISTVAPSGDGPSIFDHMARAAAPHTLNVDACNSCTKASCSEVQYQACSGGCNTSANPSACVAACNRNYQACVTNVQQRGACSSVCK